MFPLDMPKPPRLRVWKIFVLLSAGAFLVLVGMSISATKRFESCVDQLRADPSFESWTDKQKGDRFEECTT